MLLMLRKMGHEILNTKLFIKKKVYKESSCLFFTGRGWLLSSFLRTYLKKNISTSAQMGSSIIYSSPTWLFDVGDFSLILKIRITFTLEQRKLQQITNIIRAF